MTEKLLRSLLKRSENIKTSSLQEKQLEEKKADGKTTKEDWGATEAA